MSGGSWNYLYSKVRDAANRLIQSDESYPLRIALGKHLLDVAMALHDIEWVDSCDYGKGEENGAIREALEGVPVDALEELTERAEKLVSALRMEIERVRGESDGQESNETQ